MKRETVNRVSLVYSVVFGTLCLGAGLSARLFAPDLARMVQSLCVLLLLACSFAYLAVAVIYRTGERRTSREKPASGAWRSGNALVSAWDELFHGWRKCPQCGAVDLRRVIVDGWRLAVGVAALVVVWAFAIVAIYKGIQVEEQGAPSGPRTRILGFLTLLATGLLFGFFIGPSYKYECTQCGHRRASCGSFYGQE